MEKGKDRASKLFFSEMENAREIVGLALEKLGVEGDLSNITDEDPVVSFMGDDFSLERLLDKLFRVTLSNNGKSAVCLVGLENQSAYDAHMIIRVGISSLLLYERMISLNEDLMPVFIVVFNMSGGRWKGSAKIKDYFSKEVLELFGPLMVDVRMVVIDPYEMDDIEIDRLKSDLNLVMKVIKYKSDKKLFLDYIKGETRFSCLDGITARLISELGSIKIGEGETNMCKAIEDLMKECEDKGKAEGILEGKAEGIAEGETNMIFKLRREGYLKTEDAASKLGLSLDEYCKREAVFFSM